MKKVRNGRLRHILGRFVDYLSQDDMDFLASLARASIRCRTYQEAYKRHNGINPNEKNDLKKQMIAAEAALDGILDAQMPDTQSRMEL